MNGRALKITAILITAFAVIGWMRADIGPLDIRRIPPLISGPDIAPIYEVGGLVLVGLVIWGVYRLYRQPQEEEDRDLEYEVEEPEDDDAP